MHDKTATIVTATSAAVKVSVGSIMRWLLTPEKEMEKIRERERAREREREKGEGDGVLTQHYAKQTKEIRLSLMLGSSRQKQMIKEKERKREREKEEGRGKRWGAVMNERRC